MGPRLSNFLIIVFYPLYKSTSGIILVEISGCLSMHAAIIWVADVI